MFMFCTNNHQVKLLRLEETLSSNNQLKPISLLSGHSKTINCCSFMNNNKLAMTGGADKVIKTWDLEKCIATDKVILAHFNHNIVSSKVRSYHSRH